jgi:hypothetical protein
MEIVEDHLGADLDDVLQSPLFCFLSQCSDDGSRVSPLWFLWEDDSLWMIAQLPNRSYPRRVRDYPECAVAIVDFDPHEGRVRHVGMRGDATLEPWDPDRADRLLTKYLGDNERDWDDGFRGLDGENYRLIRFDPETVVARGGTHETGLGR